MTVFCQESIHHALRGHMKVTQEGYLVYHHAKRITQCISCIITVSSMTYRDTAYLKIFLIIQDQAFFINHVNSFFENCKAHEVSLSLCECTCVLRKHFKPTALNSKRNTQKQTFRNVYSCSLYRMDLYIEKPLQRVLSNEETQFLKEIFQHFNCNEMN